MTFTPENVAGLTDHLTDDFVCEDVAHGYDVVATY